MKRVISLSSKAGINSKIRVNNVGFCIYDRNLQLTSFSKGLIAIFGLEEGQIELGSHLEKIQALCGVTSLSERKASHEGPQLTCPSDEVWVVRLPQGRVIAVSGARGVDGSWIEIYEDISERERHEHRLTSLAYSDPITGLRNRTFVDNQLAFHLRQAVEASYSSLLYIDLDRFKRVNDVHGHHIGDELLRRVAKRLTACTRASDVVARIGGDEFLILQCCEVDAFAESSALATRLIATIERQFSIQNICISISASIGIVTVSSNVRSIRSIIKDADRALYLAKNSGRGTYRHLF